jgi:hypothetical protein
MCLFEKEEQNTFHQGGTYEQYRQCVWLSIVMTPAVSAPRRPASKEQTRMSTSVLLEQESIHVTDSQGRKTSRMVDISTE